MEKMNKYYNIIGYDGYGEPIVGDMVISKNMEDAVVINKLMGREFFGFIEFHDDEF